MRPIFSPSDFVQIKGRGTRKHNFVEEMFDPAQKAALGEVKKTVFRLFDFFANCEYFEETFNYDEEISLPIQPAMPRSTGSDDGAGHTTTSGVGTYEHFDPDDIVTQTEQQIGADGMRIDRELFGRFEDAARADTTLSDLVAAQNWEAATRHVIEEIFDKPNEFYTLEKLRRAAGVDRRISVRELVEKAFGLIPGFRSKSELIEDEFQKFLADQKPEEADRIREMRYFFEAYIRDPQVRAKIDLGHFADLNVNPSFTMGHLKRIPEYIKDYVSLNPFL
jgi:type I restriction enzyme R subunit